MLNVFEKILKFSKKSQKILLLENKATYEEFYNLTKKYYKFLKINVKPRQVVCICSEYSIHYLAVLFSCYLNKNVINVLDINSSNLEKKSQILNSKSSFLLIENKNTNLFKTIKNLEIFILKK